MGAPVDDRIELSGATLELEDGATVSVAQGRIDRDGAGEGTDAVARLPGGERPALDVTSDHTSWDLAARAARFEGAVVATRGDLELRCDVLGVTLAAGSPPRIVAADAAGSVVVERGAQTARAERGVLDAARGRLVLTGSPQLTDGPHTMTGERIDVWLDDDRIECSRCRVVMRGDIGAAEPDARP
jgi:lipopolysaccharide transport protein LptA